MSCKDMIDNYTRTSKCKNNYVQKCDCLSTRLLATKVVVDTTITQKNDASSNSRDSRLTSNINRDILFLR